MQLIYSACGAGTALGVGLALCFWGLGYVGWFVVDVVKGGLL